MRIRILGTMIMVGIMALASCAPAKNTTVVVKNQPRVVVVKKPRPNHSVVVIKPHRHRAMKRGRVIVIR
jgi:ABC-type uncharacterized transport system auxiliary subunit